MLDIKRHIEIVKQTRTNFIKVLDGLTLEQINAVPAGFNNSLVWNFIHSVCTQQALVYKLSGLPITAMNPLLMKGFMKGDKPSEPVSQDLYDQFKALAYSTLEQLEVDYAAGIFKAYKPYPTSYGVELNNVDEAIVFSNMHEGVHFGYILAQKRAL